MPNAWAYNKKPTQCWVRNPSVSQNGDISSTETLQNVRTSWNQQRKNCMWLSCFKYRDLNISEYAWTYVWFHYLPLCEPSHIVGRTLDAFSTSTYMKSLSVGTALIPSLTSSLGALSNRFSCFGVELGVLDAEQDGDPITFFIFALCSSSVRFDPSSLALLSPRNMNIMIHAYIAILYNTHKH